MRCGEGRNLRSSKLRGGVEAVAWVRLTPELAEASAQGGLVELLGVHSFATVAEVGAAASATPSPRGPHDEPLLLVSQHRVLEGCGLTEAGWTRRIHHARSSTQPELCYHQA